MPRFFSKGFKPQSTNKAARELIRGEFKEHYSESDDPLKDAFSDAEAYNAGSNPSEWHTDAAKGSALADSYPFRPYTKDRQEFLKKIYPSAGKWDDKKVNSTYSSLIGREYAAMLRERRKKGEFPEAKPEPKDKLPF